MFEQYFRHSHGRMKILIRTDILLYIPTAFNLAERSKHRRQTHGIQTVTYHNRTRRITSLYHHPVKTGFEPTTVLLPLSSRKYYLRRRL